MAYTASFQNGGKPNFEHNRREENTIKKQTYSSVNLEEKHITLIDENPEDFYRKTFGRALEEMNKKNRGKHNDRVMTIKSYIAKLQMDEVIYQEKKKAIYRDRSLSQKERKKALSKLGYHPGKFVYEAIFCIGNTDTVPKKGTPERAEWDRLAIEIYKDIVKQWQAKNPNIHLVGAYIHADEAGAPHLHLDYVPVAHDLKRGMKTAPSLSNALMQQGIEKGDHTYTTQMRWQDKMRDWLCELCQEHGIEAAWEDRRRSGNLELKEHRLDIIAYKEKQLRKHHDKTRNYENKIADYESRLAGQRKLSAQFNNNINAAKEVLSNLRNDIKTEEENKKKYQDRLKEVMANGNRALELRKSEVEEATNKLEETNKAIDEAKKTLELKTAEITSADETLTELNNAIKRAEHLRDEYDKQSAFIAKTIQDVKEDNFDYIEEIRLQAELKLLKDKEQIRKEYRQIVKKLVDENTKNIFGNFLQDFDALDRVYKDKINDCYTVNGFNPPYAPQNVGIEEER